MACEIDHHAHLDHQRSNRRSCPQLSFDSVQLQIESAAASIAEVLDHGSISLGRYATEPLAWEKWSVFPHDRYREELEKFKNPGLVAQKKAYFEEYYKRIRAVKALQEEEEEITQAGACQDAQNRNSPVEDNIRQILISGNNTISNRNSSSRGTICDSKKAMEGQQRYRKGSSAVKAGVDDRMGIPLSTVRAKHFSKKASLSQMPSSASTKTSQKKSFVSSPVNHKSNQPNKDVPGLQAKRTVASVRNKIKLESSRTMPNAIKQSEKSNSTLHSKINHKAGNSLLASKKSDPKAASNINRLVTKTATVPNSSLARNELVSSISSVRARQITRSTSSRGLAGKLSTMPAVHALYAKLVSSPASKSAHPMKSSINPQSLAEKSATQLPGSSKSISKDNTSTGGSRNMVKRSPNLSTVTKSSQKTGVELGQRSHVEGGKHKEGEEKLSAGLGRDPKVVSSTCKEKLSTGFGKDPTAVSSVGPGKEKLSSRLGRDPKAASLAGPEKEKLRATIGRGPKATSLAGSGKEKLSARLERGPKAATLAGPGKEKISTRHGRNPKAASAAAPVRDRNPASSMVSNIHKAPNARRSTRLLHNNLWMKNVIKMNQDRGHPNCNEKKTQWESHIIIFLVYSFFNAYLKELDTVTRSRGKKEYDLNW